VVPVLVRDRPSDVRVGGALHDGGEGASVPRRGGAGAGRRREDPAEAKAIGREVQRFDPAAWSAARFAAVVRGNVAKFGQREDLAAFLRSTRGKVIVEAAPRDRVWGIGMGASNPDARIPARWRGLNLLGFALMATREEIGR